MATTLNTMKDDKGNLCYMIINGSEIILVDVDDYNEARDLDVPRSKIIAHGRPGRQHFKSYLRKVESERGLARLVQEDRLREERRMKLEEDKLRKEQARLAKIEACKVRSKWFEHLAANDIFPKVVR